MLHYSAPPVVGGVEEVMRSQAEALVRAGDRACFLAGSGAVFHPDIPVRLEPLIASTSCQGRPTESDQIFAILRDWSQGLDVILVHNVLHMDFNLALTQAVHRLADEPGRAEIVSWAHDSIWFIRQPPDYQARPDWNILKTPHPKINYVTISESRRRQFEELMPSAAWHVVANGIDPVRYLGISETIAGLAEKHRIFERDLVLVQPARLVPHKNLETALRVTAALREFVPNPLLLIPTAYDLNDSGSRDYHRRLLELVRDLDIDGHAAFLVQEPDQERLPLKELYQLSDLLLSTSRDEGFGLTLLEAGLLKLPAACSAIPPFREVGRGVHLFGLEDSPRAVAEGIIAYLSGLGAWRMYRRVINRYAWPTVFKRELRPYLKRILEASGRI